MKKIAIIGASYLQVPLIKKASEMGLETHVFAWKANDPGENLADYFYPISIVNKEEITDKCKEIGVNGICTIASDLAVKTVNYVAEQLGLVGNSQKSTLMSSDKTAMRQAFEAGGDPSCKSRVVNIEDDPIDVLEASHNWPLIVKPADRSGSRGISLVNTNEEIIEAVKKARDASFNKVVLIEDFITGKEYSIEYISQNGIHNFLAATEKITTGTPHFIETGHIQPSGLSEEMITKVKKVVEHALDTLDIKTGASHSEIKIENDQIHIIEVGARMGGDCIGSHLVPLTTGYDYCRMVIDCALGNPITLKKNKTGKSAGVKFIMNSNEFNNITHYQDNNYEIVDIPFLNKSENLEITDSSTRLGCFVYTFEPQIH